MYRYLLFDLDGTLTDSSEGIINCLHYAFEKMNMETPPNERLRSFIGPPLQDSFHSVGMNDEEAQRAVLYFRELYEISGKFENAAAPGMAELCAELKQAGFVPALASSKVQNMCEEICEHFGFAPSMDVICGSASKGDLTKADVIRNALKTLGLTEQDKSEILMVGDRKFDVLGAKECGIDCVGVDFFGFAEPGELETAGAVAVVNTAEALKQFIFAHGMAQRN